MKNLNKNMNKSKRALIALLASWPILAAAQEADENEESGALEEVVVTGRFISSSQQLVNERMNDAFAADLLGADTISRLGDSTVAAALRREWVSAAAFEAEGRAGAARFSGGRGRGGSFEDL